MSSIIPKNTDELIPRQLLQFYELCDPTRFHVGKYQKKDENGNPIPPTYEDLQNHFNGKNGKCCMYLKAKGEKTTHLAVLDIDDHSAAGAEATEKLLASILENTATYGMLPLISPSESGTGCHVAFRFDQPQDCEAILQRFHTILTGLGLAKGKQRGDYQTDKKLQVEVRGVTDKSISLPFYAGAPCIEPDTLEPIDYINYEWKASKPITINTTDQSSDESNMTAKVIEFKTYSEVVKEEYTDLLTTGFDPGGRNNDAFATAAKLHADGTDYALAYVIMESKWKLTKGRDTFPWGECLSCLKSGYINVEELEEKPNTFMLTTLEQTMSKEENPIQWVVEDLLPGGLCLLYGKPKKGKSYLTMLNLAYSVSTGTLFLDHPTLQSEVLVLSLEDSEMEVRRRFEAAGLDTDVEGLHFVYERQMDCIELTPIPTIGNGFENMLEDTLLENPAIKLCVIDSYTKISAEKPRGLSVNQHEYRTVDALRKIALRTNCAIVLIGHERKKSTDDAVDGMASSGGLMGPPDTVARLTRPDKSNEGKLHVISKAGTGDKELNICLSEKGWEISEDQSTITNPNHQKIIEAIQQHGPMTPKQVAKNTGLKEGSVKQWLKRLKEKAQLKSDGGVYDISDELQKLYGSI